MKIVQHICNFFLVNFLTKLTFASRSLHCLCSAVGYLRILCGAPLGEFYPIAGLTEDLSIQRQYSKRNIGSGAGVGYNLTPQYPHSRFRSSAFHHNNGEYPRPQSTYINRVPQCVSAPTNWDTPPPLPQASQSPTLNQRGGNTRQRVREGGSQFVRLERKPSTLTLYPIPYIQL